MMMRVAFLGVGNMGRPMIKKLLECGYPVDVFDIRKEAAEGMIGQGARWRRSPIELADNADILITCLPLPEDVYGVMMGDKGALKGMRPGTTWIDMSTTDYHNTLSIASEAAGIGISSLEAPASNLSHMGVDFANVSFFVGGKEEAFQSSREALNTMGAISFHVGKIGQGQAVKLLTNLLFYTAAVTVGDALCVAKKLGIPANITWQSLSNTQAFSVALEQFTPFLLDGSRDSSCTLEIAVKDMALTAAMAAELSLDLPIIRFVEERYRQAGEKYCRYDNHLIVVELTEILLSVDLCVEGYIAPSKYGANPETSPDTVFLKDQIGRIKPKRDHKFNSPTVHLSGDQWHLLRNLTHDLAIINRAVLDEAYALGRGMGLNDKLIGDVITWSVGASYWSDQRTLGNSDQPYLSGTHRIMRPLTPNLDPLLSIVNSGSLNHAFQ